MRRFYSLLLTAAFLLVGMNVLAKDLVGNDQPALQAAVNAIMNGTESDPVIKLQNPVDLANPVWIGTQDLEGANGAYKSITLDLNGQKITMNTSAAAARMFVLTHGELIVTNSAVKEGVIQFTGTAGASSQVFSVYGSYRSSRWNADGTALAESGAINTRAANGGWFSHLFIDNNVKIYADNGCQGTGIAVDVFSDGKPYGSTRITNYGTALNVWPQGKTSGDYGFAYGVRVDVKGTIDIQGSSSSDSKSYGIKVNGNVASPISAIVSSIRTKLNSADVDYLKNYNNSGVVDAHKLDTLDAPFVYVYPSAVIKSRQTGKKSTAIYASGYAKWMVEGTCSGKTGVYVSSGEIDIHDAQISSTAETYTTPNGDGSANGGGSGIVVNSRDSYAGDIDITISGDTKVEGAAGYAIEEIVNTKPVENPAHATDPTAPVTVKPTKVDNITIEGGTIKGGNKGAIIIEEQTFTDAETVVYGANVTGDVKAGNSTDSKQALTDLMPGGNTTHITTLTDPVTGKTTLVVSEGAPLSTGNSVVGATPGTSVKWVQPDADKRDEILSTNLTLKDVEINNDYAQSVTIAEDVTFTANHIVLGPKAQIIVEPGAKLIVTGKQGVSALLNSNIVLKSNSTKQAIFLFDPAVESNSHPAATVELASKSYYQGGKVVYQRFGVPTYDNKFIMAYKTTPASSAYSYIVNWDYENDGWAKYGDDVEWQLIDNADGLEVETAAPFTAYELISNNAKGAEYTYTIKGNLMGNQNASIKFAPNFNPYANSYAAPIDIYTLLTDFQESYANVQPSLYVYAAPSNDNFQWLSVGLGDFEFGTPEVATIAPLATFLLRSTNSNAMTVNNLINYKENVYDPFFTPASAPARNVSKNNNYMNLVLANEANEQLDRVKVIEDGRFSSEYEGGYDAVKFMNEGANMYAVVNNEPMATVADNNVESLTISVNVKEAGNYTINMKHNGLDYELYDLVQNQVVSMAEGETYTFYQEAGKAEPRFAIVKVNKIVTGIDNAESQMKAVKVLNNGVLNIIKNGAKYNALGQEIK